MNDNLEKNLDSNSINQDFIKTDKKGRLILDRSKDFYGSQIKMQQQDDLIQNLGQKRVSKKRQQTLLNPKLFTTEAKYGNDTKIMLDKFSFKGLMLWIINIVFGHPLSKAITTMIFVALTIIFFCLYFLPLTQVLVFLIIGVIFLIISLSLLSYFVYLLF